MGSNVCKWSILQCVSCCKEIPMRGAVFKSQVGCLWFLKEHSWYNKVNTIKKNPMKDQELNKDHFLPVNIVSADHYISWTLVRLYHKKVKSDLYGMLSGWCVFINHASGYMSIKHQVAINTTASEFMEYLLKKQQTIMFSGTRASHKYGAA